MDTKNTNWLAILVTAIVNMGLGMLWYGFLFQKQWMAGNGITMEGEKMLKGGSHMDMSPTPMIVNTLAMFLYPLFMNWLINKTGDNTLQKGATLGFIIGIMAFVGVMVGNLFAANSFSLTLCDGLYTLFMWTVCGAIIGGWRKKA